MARTVTFRWQEKEYQIPKLLASEATADDGPLAILEELEAAKTTRAQIAIALRIVEAMHCPAEVRKNLAADEIEECLAALNEIQMPKQPKGNGKTVPFEGGDAASPAAASGPGASLSPASPDSTGAGSPQ